jgi:polyisoprenoid-binding protein YceI
MMISNVRGEFANTSGTVDFDGKDPTKAKVDATIDVNSINTREPKRDEHLKGADFFDAAKYPSIRFVSKKIKKIAAGKYKMTGNLTLHGVTKEVTLDVDGLGKPIKDPRGMERLGATATTKINRKEFGLSYNAALETGGVVIGEEVGITLDVELVKAKAAAAKDGKSSS